MNKAELNPTCNNNQYIGKFTSHDYNVRSLSAITL